MVPYRTYRFGVVGIAAGALLLTCVSCSEPLSTREKGALIGGGTGAGVGALTGGGTGAAIGGAAGALGGGVIGDQMQDDDDDIFD